MNKLYIFALFLHFTDVITFFTSTFWKRLHKTNNHNLIFMDISDFLNALKSIEIIELDLTVFWIMCFFEYIFSSSHSIFEFYRKVTFIYITFFIDKTLLFFIKKCFFNADFSNSIKCDDNSQTLSLLWFFRCLFLQRIKTIHQARRSRPANKSQI